MLLNVRHTTDSGLVRRSAITRSSTAILTVSWHGVGPQVWLPACSGWPPPHERGPVSIDQLRTSFDNPNHGCSQFDKAARRDAARPAPGQDTRGDPARGLGDLPEVGLAGLSLRDLAARVGRAPQPVLVLRLEERHLRRHVHPGQQSWPRSSALLRGVVPRSDLHRGARVFFEFCTAIRVRTSSSSSGHSRGSNRRPRPTPSPPRSSTGSRRQCASPVSRPRHVDLWTAIITGLTDQQISNDPGGDRWARLLDEAVDLLVDHVGMARHGRGSVIEGGSSGGRHRPGDRARGRHGARPGRRTPAVRGGAQGCRSGRVDPPRRLSRLDRARPRGARRGSDALGRVEVRELIRQQCGSPGVVPGGSAVRPWTT